MSAYKVDKEKLWKKVIKADGTYEWVEELSVPNGSREEMEKDIRKIQDWQQEQTSTLPDGVIRGIAEIQNFLEGTGDSQKLTELFSSLQNAITTALAGKADIAYVDDSHLYRDVYIGSGSTSLDVMTAANHRDAIRKGAAQQVTAADSRLFVILPATYAPTVLMEGMSVPVAAQENVTVDGTEYKVFRSSTAYSGTFNIILL